MTFFLGNHYIDGDKDSVYNTAVFLGNPTLSEVVKAQEWGHNKLITQGSIRILHETKDTNRKEMLVKNWLVVKDPHFIIEEDRTFCAVGKGTKIVLIRIATAYVEVVE